MESFKKLKCVFIVFSIVIGLRGFSSVVLAQEPEQKAVIFMLDSSGSMKTNDPNRLAIDSIAQLAYSLPSDYKIGVVSYNTGVVFNSGIVAEKDREDLIKQAKEIAYKGYTNAGEGLEAAINLLEKSGAKQLDIVILSDGEILMENPNRTQRSIDIFKEQVSRAKQIGANIHVIGLGKEMSDTESTIFSAATQTSGGKYHLPKAVDIQKAIDSILLERLGIKKNTLAVVESDGSKNVIKVSLPAKHISKARILLTSTSPITSLTADFNANSGVQVSGIRYALIELEKPTEESINLVLQSQKGSKIKVDLIAEYDITPIYTVTYEDLKPEAKDRDYYERTADIQVSFVDKGNPNIAVMQDEYFNNMELELNIDGKSLNHPMKNGKVVWSVPVTEEVTKNIEIGFIKFPLNVICSTNMDIKLEGPPMLPKSNLMLYIAGGIIIVLGIVYIAYRTYQNRKRVIALNKPEIPEPSKFSYVGRLNFYITKTVSDVDIPPLSFNLFRVSSGRAIPLKEILTDCGVTEKFEGAEKIFFKPGVNRSLILNNQSDCTIIKSREILMKNKSYELNIDSKVDITFEDEKSELVFQYKDAALCGTHS